MYYRNAQAAIVVYDISNKETFQIARTKIKELKHRANPNIVIALANKHAVSYKEAKQYADETSLLFMETSAKTAANVMDIFTSIAKKLPKNEAIDQTGTGRTTNGRNGINLPHADASAQSTGSSSCSACGK